MVLEKAIGKSKGYANAFFVVHILIGYKKQRIWNINKFPNPLLKHN